MQERCRSLGTLGRLVVIVLAAGCGNPSEPVFAPDPAPPVILGAQFTPADTGILAGRVTWEGEMPRVEPLSAPPSPAMQPPRAPMRDWPHPFRPLISTETKGVGDVVVFLRKADPERSRPWNHPPVQVEQRGYQMKVRQGKSVSRFGFVRRGEMAEMVSGDGESYVLQARGAAFFTLPFLDPHRPVRRTLADAGLVELYGGAGRYWMRAFLFVSEHPYCTRTDEQGDFVLEQVPEGEYEMVLCLPRWQVARVEYDPCWSLASRVTFRPPLEVIRRIQVRRGETVQCDMKVSSADAER